MGRRIGLTVWAAVMAGAFGADLCLGKEKATVTVSYVLGPARPLPEGLKAVAVIDAGVKTEGAQQDTREKKWSAIAADMVEAMLQHAGAQYGAELAVAKRSETRRILEEKDLRLSGLVEGAEATRAGKLLAVQGLVTSRIVINIDVQKNSKSTLDWGSVLGGVVSGLGNHGHHEARPRRGRIIVQRVPANPRDPRARPRMYLYGPRYGAVPAPQPQGRLAGGGFAFGTRDVEEISRSLTVQCSFSLIDATTGRAIAQYSPPPYQKTDSASPDFLFGGMMKQEELDPVDEFIGELVERAAQEFVATLVPVRVEKQYELALSGKRGEAAIRALRADEYETAMQQLEPMIGTKDDDDGRISFAAGIISELRGQPEQALDLYRRAASAEDVDEKKDLPQYLEAKKRLTEHLGRILPASALKAKESAPPAGEPPAQPSLPPQPAASAPAAPSQEPSAPQTVEDEIQAIKKLPEIQRK